MATDAGNEETSRRIPKFIKRGMRLQCLLGSTWAAAKVKGVRDQLSEPRKPFAWRPEEGRSVLLKGCDLIDVERGQHLKERGLLLQDGRITGVVATRDLKKATADRVFDCTGLVAIPGLINCHCHTLLPGAASSGYDLGLSLKRQAFRNFEECAVHGVTSVRDASSPSLILAGISKRIEDFELLGPRVFGCASGLRAPKGYPEWSVQLPPNLSRKWGQFTLVIEDPESGRDAVRLAAEQGARWIKLFLDDQSLEYGHRPLPTPDDETLRAVIEEAHRMGRPVGAHESVRRVFLRALDVGVDNIEHIPADELLTNKDVALFMKGDHHITPTVTVVLSLGIAREGHPARRENPLIESLQVLHERVQREVVPAVAEAAVVRANALVTEIIKSIEGDMPTRKDPRAPILVDPAPFLTGVGEANVKKLYEAGAKFCCGNDGGVPFTWPGTLFIEMEMLAMLGLSNLDVLRSATVNAAELLDVKGELGSLEAGKMADIVLLSADPLADIRAVREVEAVFRSGALLHYGPRFALESQPG